MTTKAHYGPLNTRMLRWSITRLLCLQLVLAFAAVTVHAQTFTVLHRFKGLPDGKTPSGSLVQDASGNLYGLTERGGASSNCPSSDGCGTVFKIAANGKETVLYAFT